MGPPPNYERPPAQNAVSAGTRGAFPFGRPADIDFELCGRDLSSSPRVASVCRIADPSSLLQSLSVSKNAFWERAVAVVKKPSPDGVPMAQRIRRPVCARVRYAGGETKGASLGASGVRARPS
ncbi:hypothetical protein HPB50_004612 [Hyalomma asiaticum]|uniref:Uncharacterized protein n=1 Tax=Hyalomma asiaticum TaxID=266040 RepID=A0ACB7TD39_HYAAI|nr:hypothetical protein HPB50_004612 [Hyalomma asiaticum]